VVTAKGRNLPALMYPIDSIKGSNMTCTCKGRFADLGAAVFPGSPADFGKFIVDETAKWAKVVKFAGAKAD
jgi:hypothetical protein